jgi:phage terminase large subunit-like protein
LTEDEALGVLIRRLARCPPDVQRHVIDSLSPTDRRALAENWPSQALPGQREPGGEWRTWLIMAARGFGKTRAGAAWVLAKARAYPGARIALIGGTIEEAAKVMIEGESGILACARLHEKLVWRPSTGKLKLPGDSLALLFSGATPGRLRGPQHHFAWADELGNYILDVENRGE